MFKVGLFVIEKIAEPVSNVVERIAMRSPTFQEICVEASKRVSRQANKRRSVTGMDPLPVLDRDQAVHAGSEILGEAIVWTVGFGLLYVSYREDEAAEQEQDRRAEENKQRIHALEAQLAAHQQELDQLQAAFKKHAETWKKERQRHPRGQAEGSNRGSWWWWW